MRKLKFVVLVSVLLFGTAMTSVHAQTNRQWIPRTVEEIKADLNEHTKNGMSSYTVKWGDTLYALSLAADVPIVQLANINSIKNLRLIDEGSIFYFNNDKTILSVTNGEGIESYSTQTGEKVDITQEEQLQLQEVTSNNVDAVQEETIVQEEQATLETQEEQATQNTTDNENEAQEQAVSSQSPKLYTLSQFMYMGIINWSGLKFTYYSQSVLPGGGLSIPGRHVNEDGYVADADGYIVLASSAPLGTVIDTPFGYQGKVYDRGTTGNHYDVYIR